MKPKLAALVAVLAVAAVLYLALDGETVEFADLTIVGRTLALRFASESVSRGAVRIRRHTPESAS